MTRDTTIKRTVDGTDCKVDDFEKIRDGRCNADLIGYNSEVCGWDDGDCLSKLSLGARFALFGFFVVIYLGFYMYCSNEQSPISQYFRDRQERQEGLRNHRMRELERRRTAMIFPVPSALVEEPRMDRHTLVVLTSIIHEKVVSSKKSSDNDDDYKITLLPHETILSERSTTITNCYEIQLLAC